MEWNDVEARLRGALQDFLATDKYLLEVDANERSISHRLGLHLQSRFAEWHVDCEYNRMRPDEQGRATKRLSLSPKRVRLQSDPEGTSVFPDIIVHKRGPDGPNLLVLEMKVTGKDAAFDHEKLLAYREELGYSYGVFLTFEVGTAADFGEPQRIPPN